MPITPVGNTFSQRSSDIINRLQESRKQNILRLSSGRRINSAADDAAGLAISERLTSQTRGISQAIRNIGDGVSVTQVAEGALSQSSDIVSRMRELAVQASNGTLSASDRSIINQEFSQLKGQLDQISSTTQFNGAPLLSGGSISIQAGNNATDTLSVPLSDASTSSLGVAGADVLTASNAQSALSSLDGALQNISTARSSLGASQNVMNSSISNLNTSLENFVAANSRIADADIAQESSLSVNNQIREQFAAAMILQARSLPSVFQTLLGNKR